MTGWSAWRAGERFERVRREPVSAYFCGKSLLDGGLDQGPGDCGDGFAGLAQVSGCGEQALGRRRIGQFPRRSPRNCS